MLFANKLKGARRSWKPALLRTVAYCLSICANYESAWNRLPTSHTYVQIEYMQDLPARQLQYVLMHIFQTEQLFTKDLSARQLQYMLMHTSQSEQLYTYALQIVHIEHLTARQLQYVLKYIFQSEHTALSKCKHTPCRLSTWKTSQPGKCSLRSCIVPV